MTARPRRADPRDPEQHFATPHMADFMAGLGQLSISEMDLHKYQVAEKGPLF